MHQSIPAIGVLLLHIAVENALIEYLDQPGDPQKQPSRPSALGTIILYPAAKLLSSAVLIKSPHFLLLPLFTAFRPVLLLIYTLDYVRIADSLYLPSIPPTTPQKAASAALRLRIPKREEGDNHYGIYCI